MAKKNTSNICRIIEQLQNQITELTKQYGELPDSKHYGVGGRMKPTLKQEMLSSQIKKAEERLDRLMKLLER